LYINYCLYKKGITPAELVEILGIFPEDRGVIMQSIHSSLKDDFVSVFFWNQTIAFEDVDFEDATPKLS